LSNLPTSRPEPDALHRSVMQAAERECREMGLLVRSEVKPPEPPQPPDIEGDAAGEPQAPLEEPPEATPDAEGQPA